MVKERNIAVCIILSLVTCGIYMIYWFICLTDEANNASNSTGTSGGMAFLLSLVTCGIPIIEMLCQNAELFNLCPEKVTAMIIA